MAKNQYILLYDPLTTDVLAATTLKLQVANEIAEFCPWTTRVSVWRRVQKLHEIGWVELVPAGKRVKLVKPRWNVITDSLNEEYLQILTQISGADSTLTATFPKISAGEIQKLLRIYAEQGKSIGSIGLAPLIAIQKAIATLSKIILAEYGLSDDPEPEDAVWIELAQKYVGRFDILRKFRKIADETQIP